MPMVALVAHPLVVTVAAQAEMSPLLETVATVALQVLTAGLPAAEQVALQLLAIQTPTVELVAPEDR